MCHELIPSIPSLSAVGLTYEDQAVEAKRRAADFLKNRIPKFFRFFTSVIKANANKGLLYGAKITTADLVLFQVRVSLLSLHASNPI